MVIDLLGPNLEEVKGFCQGALSVATVIAIADQLIARIEYFHSKNFLHRDIKPENFMLGREKRPSTIYIIDYGLAKRYRDCTTKMHISYKNNKRLTGTARYASINTHMGIEQSRRDDLECIAFTLVYLAKGRLPWQGITADDKADKYKKMLENKKGVSAELLCKGLPNEFAQFFHYCRSLRFEDKPDYAMLRKKFTDLFYKGGYNKKFNYDWNVLQLDLDFLLEREYSEVKEVLEEEKEVKDESIIIPEPNAKFALLVVPNITKHTTVPNRLDNAAGKSKKMPTVYVTKKLKQMKKQFLEMIQNQDDEIPDENEGTVNQVRKFECPENYIRWKNTKNFKKPRDRERNKSFDSGNSIVVHKQRSDADVRVEIRRQKTISPPPSKHVLHEHKRKCSKC
eukprot:TRINITY_DN8239_c0_g1_i1.p1 TRINITY_DN8239_c0_g1~~TRINITY_DN8239_c0_g1_i1.p1  ORF type:complete len:396 (+),score=79.90 TRINITY_DN8239_c0_g1_i1:371-1558(+)